MLSTKGLELHRPFLPVYSASEGKVKLALDNNSYSLLFKKALPLLLLTFCITFNSYAAQTDNNSSINHAASIDFVKGYATVLPNSNKATKQQRCLLNVECEL